MHLDLTDPELFGNEAGEDEDVEVLGSYFLSKPSFDRFYSPKTKIAFVRSRKGVGKSALLKHTLYKREQENSGELLIYIKAAELFSIQETKSNTPQDMIYGWQQRICTRINLELGSTLHFGFTDDSMLLIEGAELSGFRSRNLIGALLDRLKVKAKDFELERLKPAAANAQALLKRVKTKADARVWIFIDDIDATFINTPEEKIRISTFFSACRNIVNAISGICIRASVRTDVWSIIDQKDEALDKCEQYMLDLRWSTTETGRIIANKILSYCLRTYPGNKEISAFSASEDADKIRKLVFKEPFNWAGRALEAFRPIHILSAGRPRWAAQLCKLAGNDACSKSVPKISIGHVHEIMEKYGKLRVADLYKEHNHQCEQLEAIVESFSCGRSRYTTSELLTHITDKIIKIKGSPIIDGRPATQGSLTVANFLFRIGFIDARDDTDDTGLGFVCFEERPNLLSSTTNLDDNLDWEIHPSYRKVLRIQPSRGIKQRQ